MSFEVSDAFSASYREARAKFLNAVQAGGLQAEARLHPGQGRDGEELAMDVAREGDPNADAVLIVTSACHGVEGYCGSGIQVAALRDAQWREYARSRGVAVVYVHALNPFGFSHFMRTTQENVDLNRNFHDYDRPLPVNEHYRELHELLLPVQWPPTADNQAAIGRLIAERGETFYQAAITRGQHEYPDGMFFGGTAPSWSNKAWREVLRHHAHRCAKLSWIDIHTGLGPSGVGERIYAGNNDAAAIDRAKRWWDGGGRTPVTSIYDGSSSAAFLTGLMWGAVYDECAQAEYTGLALEYGTEPIMETLEALRGSYWLRQHPEAPPALAEQIRQRMYRAFFTDTAQWKATILAQAQDAMVQAVDGLTP